MLFSKKATVVKSFFKASIIFYAPPLLGAYHDRGFDDLDCRNSTIVFANVEEKPYICKCKQNC